MYAVNHNELTLAYEVFGSGQNVVLALHGHSKSPTDYETFAREDLRIIAPSLFHHGYSTFPEKRINKNPLTNAEVFALIEQILNQESVDRFHMVAYSQGGRFALKIMEKWGHLMESVTLLSPDGIDYFGYYQRASLNRVNRALMAHFERYPRHFRTTMKLVNRLGLVNAKVVEMSTELSKSKFHMACASQSWRNFRLINSAPITIGDVVKEHQINFKIYMGHFDGIFPKEIAFKFVREAGLPDDHIEVLPCGHDFFKQEAIELYINQLPFLNNGYIYAHEKADATYT